jgi:hypothetical protein
MGPADVPPAYVFHVCQLESGCNDAARNRGTNAGGRYQFMPGTWDALRRAHPELHLTAGGRFDRAQADRAFRVFTAENGTVLERALGRQPTNSELWLAHFLGSAGARKFLTAGDQTPLLAVVGPKVIAKNRFLRELRTVAGLRRWARAKMPDQLPTREDILNPAGRGPSGRRTAADLNELELNRVREGR